MKKLKFNHTEAENIKKGLQKATLRVKDDKDIAVGDNISVVDRVEESDPGSWQAVGVATVNRITEQRFGDIDIKSGLFENYGSLTELYKQFSVFYGEPINENTVVKIVYFDFKVNKNEEKQNNSVDYSTTKHVELKLFADGGSRGNPGPSASGFVIMDMKDRIIETNGEYLNITTNNQAEYNSLKLGLERSKQLGAKKVNVFMDSMLVINQMKGVYKVRNKDLIPVHLAIKKLTISFDEVIFTHIPRELNKLADAEVNRILDSINNMV